MTLGYWNDPKLTATVYRSSPVEPGDPNRRVVFTGDLGKRDADGFLYCVGRKDRVIKTLGYRVGPDEITDVKAISGRAAHSRAQVL